MNNGKEPNRIPFLSPGSSSLLLVFLVLCLVLFAVLTLSSAASDFRFSERLAQRRQEYYAASNQAEEHIAELDRSGALSELSEPLSFQVPVNDRQFLFVKLCPDEDSGFRISAWQLQDRETDNR